jgi:hypothetical protein
MFTGSKGWVGGFNVYAIFVQLNVFLSFICAGTQVFGTASIVVSMILNFSNKERSTDSSLSQWGVIGPGLQFSKSGVY